MNPRKVAISIAVLLLVLWFVAACLHWHWLFFAAVLIWFVVLCFGGFVFITASAIRIFLDWVKR